MSDDFHHSQELARMLNALLEHYLRLANSGDAGNWDPEQETVVVLAREHIAGQRERARDRGEEL
jgi:hypothetical protein